MSVAMLCEQLVKSGCEVMVYTTTANGANELEVTSGQSVNIDGVDVIYFTRITKDHTHLSPALLRSVWRNVKKYDVVHIQAWWNLVSVLSCLIAVWRKVPVVVSPRGTLSPYSFRNKNGMIKSLIHRMLTKPLLKKCHIHTTSVYERDAVDSIITHKINTTVYNFVKLPVYQSQEQNVTEGPVKLIFLSRIEEKKGLDILLNALGMVKTLFHLTIAGTGDRNYIDQLRSLAIQKNIDDHITWTGFVNDSKFELLGRHDLFILPSHDENFGNTVIESLSVGTPVLISKKVGLADYVDDKKLGWLCQPNPQSVSEAIDHIAQQHTDLLRIRNSAPAIIRNDFDESRLINQYKNMYQQIITA
jgi:glycosyltransferase involved in cell wall biosynthesis